MCGLVSLTTNKYTAMLQNYSAYYKYMMMLLYYFNYVICSTYNSPGSMNINYDPVAKKAITSSFGNQFRFDNTYAYFGATFYANVQFSWKLGFAFEVSLGGGAGYNIDFQMPNGLDLTEGTKSMKLMGAGTKSSSKLITGIY